MTTMKRITIPNTNILGIKIATVLHHPPRFSESGSYAAIAVTHPGGGVKEQTAGTYARKLAAKGFVTIAYDASYQGESTGEPRQLENPYVRTQDVSAVVDYLTTLSYVDNKRIGGFGVCAGGGYTANAALNDYRIQAIGAVSLVNLGATFRHGFYNTTKTTDAIRSLEAGSNARTADAASGSYSHMPMGSQKEEDAATEELRQSWEYYRTPRGQCPTAPGFTTTRSLNQIITYDAFNMAEIFLTRPILAIAGSEAGSKWMSEDLIARAASKDKVLHVIEGANHIQMYDGKEEVEKAVELLAPFFEKNLA